MKISKIDQEKEALIRFNLMKIISLSSFVPFEIYSLLYLSSTKWGEMELGTIMILALLFGILSGPHIGTIIDQNERKKIINKITVLWIIIFSAGSLLWNADPNLKQFLIPVIFLLLDFLESIFFAALRSLQKTINSARKYGISNSLSEITGQFPTIIGASLAMPILSIFGAKNSLIISIPFLVAGLLLMKGIKENYTPVASDKKPATGGSGYFSFMRKNFSLIFFFYLLNFTFIITTVGNLLKPVFIVQVLHGTYTDISFSEIAYSVFGMAIGFVLTTTSGRFTLKHCYLFMIIFTAGCFFIPSSTSFLMYLGFQSANGIGNPGNRVARNTILMRGIPNEISGRFYAGISFMSNITRIVLLLIFTVSLGFVSSSVLISICGIVMLVAIFLSAVTYKLSFKVKEIARTSI